jgi:hypothetical protein
VGNELVRRISENAGISVRSGSQRVPRPVVRQVDRAGFRGLEVSAKVQAAAYVTHVALSQVGMLTAEEGRMIEQHPLGEPRFRVIVDTFTGMAAAEIARLGY